MEIFLDTEFQGFGGELISLALIPERGNGNGLYFIFPHENSPEWVRENVLPNLYSAPVSHASPVIDRIVAANMISEYFLNFQDITIDWAEDLAHFFRLLLVSPGQCVYFASDIRCELVTGNLPEIEIEGAVNHNAWWDAIKLREQYGRRG